MAALGNFKQLYYLFTRDENSHWKNIERTINYLLRCFFVFYERETAQIVDVAHPLHKGD